MSLRKVDFEKKIRKGRICINNKIYVLPDKCEIVEYLPPKDAINWFGELLFEYKNSFSVKEYPLNVNPFTEKAEIMLLEKIFKSENIAPLFFYKLRNDVYINNINETYIRISKEEFNQKIINNSGKIFISVLSQKPQTLDELATKIIKSFVDVDIETIKKDAEEFYETLINEGFIIKGETKEELYLKDNNFEKIETFRVYVTEKCNANCPSCFNAKSRTSKEMSLEEFEKLCEYLSSNGIKHLKIMGGEPTVHKDFEELVKISQKYFREITIF